MEKVLCIEDLERKLEQFQIILTNSDNVKKDILELTEQMVEMVANYKKTQIDFQLICNHLNTTLFVTDDRVYVCYVNPSYEERTGLKKEYILGKTIFELQKENVIQCDVIPRMLKEEKPINAIGYVVSTDYRGFVAGIPVKDENGKLRYAITTDWDVMSIMEMENRLKQLQKGEIPDSTDEAGSVSVHTADEEEILYTSDVMRDLISLAKTVAQTDVSVLITGETGTGKEVFAQAIHRNSLRKENAFVAINCSAFSKDLLESEIFGHKAGSFTGAMKDKKGLFEVANNGTIFLDEIGEMAFELQAKLLRVLESGEYIKIGDTKPTKVNVRIISATNRDLKKEIEQGNFREDLYYRLSVFQIHLPPLRERKEDIEILARTFIRLFSNKLGKQVEGMTPEFLTALKAADWRGNIRELRNVIERSMIICDKQLTLQDLPIEIQNSQQEELTSKNYSEFELAAMEKHHITKVLQYTKGNKTEASRLLKIGLTTLYRKIEEYGISL